MGFPERPPGGTPRVTTPARFFGISGPLKGPRGQFGTNAALGIETVTPADARATRALTPFLGNGLTWFLGKP